MSHNGWKNYETWAVYCWLSNEEQTENEMQSLARDACEGELLDDSDRESAVNTLADQIKDNLQDGMPELDGMWGDLLGAAFSEVDWYEIAEHYATEELWNEIVEENAEESDSE